MFTTSLLGWVILIFLVPELRPTADRLGTRFLLDWGRVGGTDAAADCTARNASASNAWMDLDPGRMFHLGTFLDFFGTLRTIFVAEVAHRRRCTEWRPRDASWQFWSHGGGRHR
ncbi:MAG: hypothetical protein DME24_04415 [Verrucomicrobia bacterium]|nr:MAG: hypothetical protein DME24_04415 [Verrucomicrobiota bacterium]